MAKCMNTFLKRKYYGVIFIWLFGLVTIKSQIIIKDVIIRVGRYQTAVTNDMARSSIDKPGWTLSPGESYAQVSGVPHLDNVSIDYSMVQNWLDPDGKTWANVTVFGAQYEARDIRVPLQFSDSTYIHNYIRYPQTLVTVKGKVTSSSEPRGELNPEALDAMGTTADQYVENKLLTNVGLEFTRKIYAWSHFQDNNYVIVEMIVKNVGVGFGPNQKVKTNYSTWKSYVDTVKLPVQTIHGFLYGTPKIRYLQYIGPNKIRNTKPWIVHYGFRKGDSLRMLYSYDGQREGKQSDVIGEPNLSEGGVLNNYLGHFQATIYAPKSVNDRSDDITQPRYTAYVQNWNSGSPKIWDEAKGKTMRDFITNPDIVTPHYEGSDILPALHQVNMDERGYDAPYEIPNYYQWARSHAGPYEIPPNDSIKFVFAIGSGGLSPKVAFKVGRDWMNGVCKFEGQSSSPLTKPQNRTDNDWAKDQWVFTEIDSMKKTAARASWNYNKYNLKIPVPPPPLKWLKIEEKIGAIKLSWSDNAESDPNFQGYRIYRAQGASDTTLYSLIAELSKRKGNLKNEYYDTQIDRGPDYYYYVSTFSISDAFRKGEILESGKNYIQAFSPVRYVPKEGLSNGHWQDSVRVVPNPFNLAARDVQFSRTPNKIMFVNLPKKCTIRIYSENGNLIKKINHSDGKSDEQWEVGGQYLLTDSGQRVVSGIYVAHFQTPEGESAFLKFVIIR